MTNYFVKPQVEEFFNKLCEEFLKNPQFDQSFIYEGFPDVWRNHMVMYQACNKFNKIYGDKYGAGFNYSYVTVGKKHTTIKRFKKLLRIV
jgi:hypothetical protein